MPRANFRGGLSSGMHASEFDPRALRRGTKVEMEHTSDPKIAQRIAMDHLVEDQRYYEKLAKIEAIPNTRCLSERQISILTKLDEDLSELGFPDQLENVFDENSDEDPVAALNAFLKDLWDFHFHHVGDEESRPIYEEAEDLTRKALAQLGADVCTPNKSRSRVRVFDAEEDARKMRETFTAKPVKERVKFSFRWPAEMQHVGDSLAVAYSSDKWKQEGDMELYKHLAESRNRVLCVPGFLRDAQRPDRELATIGPVVSFESVQMPRDFAILALFEEANLQLHTAGTDEAPAFRNKKDGVVKVTVAHGMLAGGKMKDGRVFLVVYTDRDGPLMLIFGDELDVEADGIVG